MHAHKGHTVQNVYHRLAMARALVTPAARAHVDFLYTSRPTAAFSTCNYRMHACNLDVLMKACMPMCTAVCMHGSLACCRVPQYAAKFQV